MRPGVSFSAGGDQSDGHHVKESWMNIGLGGLAPFYPSFVRYGRFFCTCIVLGGHYLAKLGMAEKIT